MLRDLQRNRIKKFLEPQDVTFKILVLDGTTTGILSSLMRVADLRNSGVALHLSIDDSRSEIPEAPAVYFISDPNELIDEINRDLYGEYHINFLTTIPRETLEHLAVESSKKQNALKIKEINDQFLAFTAIQNQLFTLGIKDSFAKECKEMEIMGLFSVFMTLNELPVIFSEKETDMTKELAKKLKLNRKAFKNNVKRPILIVLEREFDVVTPVQHTIGYVELIHDILGIHDNKVNIDGNDYDIDTDAQFFQDNQFNDFPSVAEVVERTLHTYKKEMAVRSITEASSKDDIQKALENAPHLQKQNEIITTNLSICMKILDEIRVRKLDDYYQMEQDFDKSKMMELSDNGTDLDVIRFAISFLNTKNEDLIEPLFEKRKIPLEMVEYFRRKVKTMNLADKMKRMIFRKGVPICEMVEGVLNQIKNRSVTWNIEDFSQNGVYISEVSSVVVYIRGGAVYGEYKALRELEKVWKIPVVLGGSEILNAEEFLRQIKMKIDE